MNERYRNLGVATVAGVSDDGGAEFRRRLRQLEAGAAELNLDPAAVHIAAEIAALQPDLDDDRRLALIALVTASLAALQEGSTRLPVVGEQARAPMRRIAGSLCGEEFAGGPDAVIRAIEKLLEGKLAPNVIGRADGEVRPLIYLPPFIYHHRVRLAELNLAGMAACLIRKKLTAPPHKIDSALAEITATDGGAGQQMLALSPQQREAVANAASHPLALISGGPGTGKTTIILAILRVLVRIGVEPEKIALAAPTGKAAFRMGESINHGLELIANPAAADLRLKDARLEPRTIHRLLGFSPSRQRFLFHRNNRLDQKTVIVDEASMLDLSLMERLVSALNECNTRLILLGDADQLPSVAAGAVFRDLVQAAGQAQSRDPGCRGICTRLTHSYRMDISEPAGAAVFALAQAINSGDDTVALSDKGAQPEIAWRAGAEELQFAGVELLPASEQMDAFLERWYRERVASADVDKLCRQTFVEGESGFGPEEHDGLAQIFDRRAASRILCFTRVFSAGAERINAALHRRRLDDLGVSSEREFVPGEPVIVTRNDYERMLFNGDQGVIVRVRRAAPRGTDMAVFKREGKFVAYHLAGLRESLELCYATTIHKAQGSEFDTVAVILPHRDLPILTREALYTAVSRGRRGAVICGPAELLRTGIGRAMERFSGLAEELVRSLKETR